MRDRSNKPLAGMGRKYEQHHGTTVQDHGATLPRLKQRQIESDGEVLARCEQASGDALDNIAGRLGLARGYGQSDADFRAFVSKELRLHRLRRVRAM